MALDSDRRRGSLGTVDCPLRFSRAINGASVAALVDFGGGFECWTQNHLGNKYQKGGEHLRKERRVEWIAALRDVSEIWAADTLTPFW